MRGQKNQFRELLERSEWTATEMQWMLNHLENSGDSELKEIMQRRFSDLPDTSSTLPKDISDKILNVIHGKIGPVTANRRSNVFSLKRMMVAASVLCIVLLSAFLLINLDNPKSIAGTETQNRQFKDDVDPGGNKATLTLADGSVIVLDYAKNGTLTRQGNSKIIKLDGKLLYNIDDAKTKELVYNTISTPKGGQYQLELPDGSLVWLNASSSIHFPTAFTGNERRVEITGEAYFEITKDLNKPFIVSVNSSEIQVLGTHFNVNAYSDEEELKTTLLEGSIKFTNGASKNILQPGQQAQLAKEGNLKLASNVDVEEVVAWKNGLFSFESAGIEKIMRQLSRWYDVEIEYKGKTDDLFIAEMRRDIKLSDALKALELTGKVRFDINGKRVIVMP